MAKLNALRYHGGKWMLAPWIISHFPAHRTYIEPFGGAAGVLLRKPRSYAEIYNDLDGGIVNFFKVIRDPVTRSQLRESLSLTPYARNEFYLAYATCESLDSIEQARRLVVRAQMSFGSSGASRKDKSGFRTSTNRASNTPYHLWAKFPDSISEFGKRFAGVLIENRPAIQVMSANDAVDTLHYVDPPYVFSTRTSNPELKNSYAHEMNDSAHEELLTSLLDLKGNVVLSGYENEMYNDILANWKKVEKEHYASGQNGGSKRLEILWIKTNAPQGLF